MKKIILIIAFCFINFFASAQNLVPNGGFEQYSGCPDFVDEFDSALYWFTPTRGTSDYYNSCDTTIDSIYGVPNTGVPVNLLGHQSALQGNAYAGIVLYWDNYAEYREYLEVLLNDSLSANQAYHFQMFVNRADNCQYTTDDIGAYFSDTLITNYVSYAFLPMFIPQINNNTGNYFDSLNWTMVSGDFIAQGGEKYLIIGNFKNDANTYAILENINTIQNVAYCYIDDVSLTQITGINSPNSNTIASVYPNPVTNSLTIQANNNQSASIILYDIASRKILEQEFINNITINTTSLAKGIYFYEINNKEGVIKQGKMVKE